MRRYVWLILLYAPAALTQVPTAAEREDVRRAIEDLQPAVDVSNFEPAGDVAERPSTRDAAQRRLDADASGGRRAPDVADLSPAVDVSDVSAVAAARTSVASARPASRVVDTLDLGTTSITGNQELPKVLYIVPWKRSDLGDLVGRPVNTLLDEVLAPIDPAVFERHLDYYETLYGESEQE